MVFFYVLGTIVFIAVGVVGFLFYLLSKELPGKGEVKVVPIHPQELIQPAGFSPETEEYRNKIEELEEELRAFSQKSVTQAQETMAAVDTLTKENQTLKEQKSKQDEEIHKQFVLAQDQMQQMHQDNTSLQVQLQSSQAKVIELQELAVVVRKQVEGEIAQARAVMEQLKAERDAFLTNREASVQSVQALTREFEEVKAQYEALLGEAEGLRLTNAKLKELNDHLMEKNQLVQYELAKHRAQASGLEKICENYKMQLAKRV